MRKKLALILVLALMLPFVYSFASVLAAGVTEEFDGTKNYATSKEYWADDIFPDETVFNQSGITYQNWGAASNWAGNSFTSLLAKDTTIEMDFNITAIGLTKLMLIIDNTQTMNGKALKWWEIEGTKEHIVLEINKDGVFLFRNNVDNVSGEHLQQTVNTAAVNYLDGQQHTMQFSFAPADDGSGIEIKLMIGETAHFDGVIASAQLYDINPVLTLGLGNEFTAGESANISSVKITDNAGEGTTVKEPKGLLLNAEDWIVNDVVDGEITIDEEKGAATFSGYNNDSYGMTYKNKLPVEFSLSFSIISKDVSNVTNNDKGLRIVLLDSAQTKDGSAVKFSEKNDTSVFIQIDANNNMWIFYIKDGSIERAPGIANTGLARGTENKVTITAEADYEYSCLTYSVYINGVKKGGLDIEDLSLINSYYLTLGGNNDNGVYNASWTVSELEVKDDMQMPSTNPLKAAGLEIIAYDFADGEFKGEDGSAWFATGAVIKNGEPFSFKLKTSSEWANNYYFLNISNYQADCWNADLTEGRATVAWDNFNTIKLFDSADNSAGTWKANPLLSALMTDGEFHTLEYSFVSAENSYMLVLTVDGEKKAEIELNGTPLETAEYLVVSGRQTGGTGHAVISDFTAVTTDSQTIYDLMQSIYALPAAVNAENYEEVSQSYDTVINAYQALSEDNKLFVENYVYLENVFAALSQAEAEAVISAIDAIIYESLTAENIESVRTAVESVKTAYQQLSDEAKAYVTNYSRIADIDDDIEEYDAETERINGLKAEAKAIDDAIDAIDYENITAENVEDIKESVADVKTAYNVLSDDAKEYVENYSKIATIEAAIAAFEKDSGGCAGCGSSQNGTLIIALALLAIALASLIRKKKKID